MNVATGRLELARETGATEHFEEVANAHERMESLIDTLLALARDGEEVGTTEPVDLATLTEACWSVVATTDAGLVLETEQSIDANPRRLRQLLENLIRNAIEHGGEGVTVTVGELEDESGFYVADDGPGISTDESEKVFESGYSTTANGTGLGLTIVRDVVEEHGWSIEISERNPRGSKFVISDVNVR
ncbi:sensor histidine kinase [Natrarchaeobius halalkaliphilus]|uniref:sensor histidine kinase n=1 Tax=Natrarchaeobius halalkaliphilus TaxID=1679091 RepID=UPI001FB33537|nr:HAMP domain-containing sensor histidine kinase [Natrarchaeobius halalkaliphilus]